MYWCTQGPIYHAPLYRSREKTVLEEPSMCSTHIFSILGVGNQRLRDLGKINLSVNINKNVLILMFMLLTLCHIP